MKLRTLFATMLTALLVSGAHTAVAAEQITAKSPNGKITLTVTVDERISYAVNHERDVVLAPSHISLTLADGRELGRGARLQSKKSRTVTEHITSPFYRQSEFTAVYTDLDLKFRDGFGINFRVYDDGVGYRFNTSMRGEVVTKGECAEFNIGSDRTVYLSHSTNRRDPYAMAFQNTYSVTPISHANPLLAFMPATVDLGGGKKLTITEADLESYPGMFLHADTVGMKLWGAFASYPATLTVDRRGQQRVGSRENFLSKGPGTRNFPWRVLAITEKDTDMPVNNMVYALATPNRIGDYGWIKPGKVAWDWWNDWGLFGVDFKAGIDTRTYKYYIDFASKYGIEYVVLDEGWYTNGDMFNVVPSIDLPELLRYAKSKNVDIVLWCIFNVLDQQLEEACSKYSAMGVKGFKVDFLDRDDQLAMEQVYRICEGTAKHHLFLDLHGIAKPTGLNRTYPHVLNFEAVFGMEEVKWTPAGRDMPGNDVTFPFIRMMAGVVDYTPGAMRNATRRDYQPMYSNPQSMGTRAHQVATYVVYDSPFSMLCDAPTNYEMEPECTEFIVSMPVVTHETKILAGEIGKYLVSARRNGTTWYVGGMTNWDQRDVTVDFSFLGEGTYKATIFKDGPNAAKQARDYTIEQVNVSRSTRLDVHMASGGGFAIRIEK